MDEDSRLRAAAEIVLAGSEREKTVREEAAGRLTGG